VYRSQDLFVYTSIAERFVEKLSTAVSGAPVGEGKFDPPPLYEPGKVAKME
jgi:hypothetical protein